MLAIEQRKPKRKDIKTLEKDIKILTGIFTDKRLFIKVHMIYKKYTTVGPRFPGLAFFAIAHFYNVLQTTNGCQKLLKNTLKVCFAFALCLLVLIYVFFSFFSFFPFFSPCSPRIIRKDWTQ
jgi:hypothetical protein